MPRRRELRRVAALALVAAALLLIAGASGADEPSTGAAGWESLLGDRPTAQLGNRWVVVLAKPSLASHVSPRAVMRRRSASAAGRCRRGATSVTCSPGSRSAVPRSSRSTRSCASSTASQPRSTPARSRSSQKDPDVRASTRCAPPSLQPSIPRTIDDLAGAAGGRRANLGIPGFTGAGVTVALLDTGVDLVHPYIRAALLRGLDVLDPFGDASARQNPTQPGRPERHGTEMAGLVAGSGGPAGLQGVAPGAALLPIRVAGWQPDAAGGVSVYGRTDQVLAGMELAVDPNSDGDAHDAARVTLIGVVEPFAAFQDSPLARAASGAAVLDSLVIAPAGNDGPAGPGVRQHRRPRRRGSGAHRRRDRHAPPQPHRPCAPARRAARARLGRAAPRRRRRPGALRQRPGRRVVALDTGDRRRGRRACAALRHVGFSRVGGAAVLLPRGTSSPEAVREVVAAGARAVLVDGPLPAGALGTDGPCRRSDPRAHGRPPPTRCGRSLRKSIPVSLAVGAAAFDENADRGATAPFSSEGLSFDGGPKPEVSAPGVGLATSDPGRDEDGAARYGTLSGSSAAAALDRRCSRAARAGAAGSRRGRPQAGARRVRVPRAPGRPRR